MVEGHQRIGLRYVQAARLLGLHPITLSADPTCYQYLAPEGNEAICVNTDDLNALIRECSRLRATHDIAGITGFSGGDESACVTAGKLCRHFNLPGPNPRSIERCYDKFTQRQLLAEAGVPVPAYRLATNATDVERSAAEIGLPVIVKPAVGSGSSGVRLCRNVDELAEHASYLLDGKRGGRSSPRILVEEFAHGPYFSTDMMGNEVVGIASADFEPPPNFVFRECTYPASLSDDEYKRIVEVSLRSLQALSLGWGPTCIEIRWAKQGPVVIEVNPRIAGGTNPQLVQLAYGIDLIAEHIKIVTGAEYNLRKTRRHAAAARCLNPDRDGILDWIDGVSRAAAVTGVAEAELYVGPKTPIVRKGDYRDRIGHVIAVSPSPAGTEAILQRAVDLISWSIIPFPSFDGQQ